jgi:hypothetical protein
VVDGAGCDDGSACTVADRCQAGVCAGVPKDCDDGIACTTDSCDPVTGECLHVGDCCLNIAECEDEDPCTIDICEATTNKCMYEQIGCDDADPCTDDWCEPFVGCRHTSNTSCVLPCDGFAQCDDGNLCTEDECDPLLQQCVHYTVDCHDTDWCTQDFCVPDEGCRHVQVAGCQHCESDAQCTLPENQCISAACDPEEMQCKYAEKKCDDGDPCTADYCIPETGACAADYVCCEKDADCDPGNACTTGKCAEGKCKLTPISCDDKNPCTLDSCDLRIGCFHEVIKGCR